MLDSRKNLSIVIRNGKTFRFLWLWFKWNEDNEGLYNSKHYWLGKMLLTSECNCVVQSLVIYLVTTKLQPFKHTSKWLFSNLYHCFLENTVTGVKFYKQVVPSERLAWGIILGIFGSLVKLKGRCVTNTFS